MDSNAKNCYACVCIAGRGDDKGSQFSCDDNSVLLPNNSNNNDDIEVVVTWDARRLQAFAVFDDSSQRLTGEQQSPMGLGIIAHSLGGTLTNFISIEICHRHVVNVSLVVNTDRPGRQAGQIKRVRALHDGDELRAAGSNQVLYILSSPKCSTVGAVVAAAAAVAAGANQSHTIFICLSVWTMGIYVRPGVQFDRAARLHCGWKIYRRQSMHAEYLLLLLPLMRAPGEIAS